MFAPRRDGGTAASIQEAERMTMETDSGDMELRRGTIVRVDGGLAVVRIDRDDGDCGGCGSCSAKGLCGGRGDKRMELPVRLDPESGVQVGDTVAIAYRPGRQGLAALTVFPPPLLGLVFGGFAAMRLFGGGSDGVFLAGAAAGLAIGLGAAFALSRLFPNLGPGATLIADSSAGSTK